MHNNPPYSSPQYSSPQLLIAPNAPHPHASPHASKQALYRKPKSTHARTHARCIDPDMPLRYSWGRMVSKMRNSHHAMQPCRNTIAPSPSNLPIHPSIHPSTIYPSIHHLCIRPSIYHSSLSYPSNAGPSHCSP